jgi:inorganic phosphate transporter, PiT family
MIELCLFAATLLLAYANGANDNFKGVATLYGSGVLTYRWAKILSTAATLIGAVAAALLAEQLAKAFSGRGLVPSSVVANPAFAISVAFAAAATVLLATRIGMPISTTHALVGGLAGAGWAAAASELNVSALGQQFFIPLLLGPLAAFVLAMTLNRIALFFSLRAADVEACACVVPIVPTPLLSPAVAATALPSLRLGTMDAPACRAAASNGLALSQSSVINMAHITSAFMVCAARGLNDAPKIAGLLLVLKATNTSLSTAAIAVAMGLGGWLHSRRIANTMSHKITTLEPRSGFIANVCTTLLVASASKFGLPLSTTHVSVGAISGLSFSGDRSAALSAGTMRHILLAWIFTLPVAAISAFIGYHLTAKLI